MRHIVVPDENASSNSELSSNDEQKKTELNFLKRAVKKIIKSEGKVD